MSEQKICFTIKGTLIIFLDWQSRMILTYDDSATIRNTQLYNYNIQ